MSDTPDEIFWPAFKRIEFSVPVVPACDRRHSVTWQDLKVLLKRMPLETWSCLKTVRFDDRGRGRRVVGYVTRGRREITLCARPPRVSYSSGLLTGQTPATFGALRNCQWPALAIRRFFLYDVFLHELGHLQPIRKKSHRGKSKGASEGLAKAFAQEWREHLWEIPFQHPDPVHNPPTAEEMEEVRAGWREAHALFRKTFASKKDRGEKAVAYERVIELFPKHADALLELGMCYLFGAGEKRLPERAAECFKRAKRWDPALPAVDSLLGFAKHAADVLKQ